MTTLQTPKDWVKFIAKAELPAFGNTLSQIGAINEFMMSHSADLTRVILHDPLLTTKILRIANTIPFNPSQKKISTISRAVAVLGFQTIRTLCVATLLLDQLLKRTSSEPLRREIAAAFDTAMQAREIALARREPDAEKIFIAALLSHIGALSFWACGGTRADQLAQLLARGIPAEEAEEEILGFSLAQLTSELAREWRINDTLIHVTSGAIQTNPARCVQFANDIARKTDCDMQTPESEALLANLTEFAGKNSDEWRQLRKDAQGRAIQMLKACGAGDLTSFFTGTKPEPLAGDNPSPEPGIADPCLQLAVLREMVLLTQSKTDINLVLQLVLEGIHRGAGLKRAGVALLNPARSQLAAKYFVEWPVTDLQNRFQFDVAKTPILQSALTNDLILWAGRDADSYGFGVVLKTTAAADCLIGPLMVNGKTIGIFYADRGKEALSDIDAEAFELFILQARLCLKTFK